MQTQNLLSYCTHLVEKQQQQQQQPRKDNPVTKPAVTLYASSGEIQPESN